MSYVKIFAKNGFSPEYRTVGSAGCDLVADILCPVITISPGEITRIPIGINLEIPRGFVGLLLPRSSMSVQGILTHIGVIDSDFRGTPEVILQNLGDRIVNIERGSRIAQLLVLPIMRCNWLFVNSLDDLEKTDRGDSGFGSTGK